MSIKIPTNTVKSDFNHFLQMEDNSRILFSGKFGIGKTHFLNEFFSEKTDLYEVFHLYPVNYQINANDDIASLLKYDIIIELLKKNPDLFKEKALKGVKESSLLFWSWIREKYSVNDILTEALSEGESLAAISPDPLITVLSKLGRPLKDLLKIDKEFQEFKKEYKAGEKGLIEKYIEKAKNSDISEPDYISQLVKEKVFKQKGEKKSVLVLDDLDRVDPEHIFRLLNLFSAFFEREDQNRFGFDLIVVVADYQNLKHIFHHKYGSATDFSGYVNKFFTISPFYFDNKRAIIDSIEEIVKSIKNEEPGLNDAIGESGYIKLFLEHIFVRAVECGAINLRELLKATRFQFLELKKGGFYVNRSKDGFEYIFDIAIRVAILSFANLNAFLNVVSMIKESSGKTRERMPFDRYITAMVKSLKLNTSNKSFYWNKYQISWNITDGWFAGVTQGTHEELFCDLLTAYVRSKEYLK